MRWNKLGLIAVALVLASSVGFAAEPKPRYREWSRDLAPGVTLTNIRDPEGPWAIRILEIDPLADVTLDSALGTDMLPGFERTSSIADRYGALAAVNGDYARPSGRPVMTFAEDGVLGQTPLIWGRNFSISSDESVAHIGHPQTSAFMRSEQTGIEHEVQRVNEGPPGPNQIALFTVEGGNEETPPELACSARLRPAEPPHLRAEDATFVEQNHLVEKVACSDAPMGRKGATVVSTPVGGAYAPVIETLTVGETVTISWTLGWYGVLDTVGGNPTLLENGQIVAKNVDGEGTFFRRHPRTGVATTQDGKILLVTVDGRQPEYSVGMTPREFAELFESLEATSALNLDGGGSTTMVVNGNVKNKPSSGSERPVSSALLVLPGPDDGESTEPTEPPPGPGPGATWALMARDGGSIGGLASFLEWRGYRLPGFLQRALAVGSR
jgi:Phosphodiester glycosidase